MKNNFEVEKIGGNTPFLFSAPHACAHKRPSLASKYKQGEPWTDYIVRNICSESNAFGILSSGQCEYDPNYYKIDKNEYKQEVKEIIVKKKIEYFFDIHGLSDQYQYDFGIYYLNKYTKSRKLAYDLAEFLNTGVLRNCLIQILNIPEVDRETLTEFATSNLKVPSLQIEISRYIREEDNLREGFIKNFSDFLTTLK